MADNIKVSLVHDALNMAIEHRNQSSGLLWHTDRGSQYAYYSHFEFYYNRVRSHSYLGNLSPSKFEEINLVLQLDTIA